MSEKRKPASTDKFGKPETPESDKPKSAETDGLSPTRYGDWEKNGRCIDF